QIAHVVGGGQLPGGLRSEAGVGRHQREDRRIGEPADAHRRGQGCRGTGDREPGGVGHAPWCVALASPATTCLLAAVRNCLTGDADSESAGGGPASVTAIGSVAGRRRSGGDAGFTGGQVNSSHQLVGEWCWWWFEGLPPQLILLDDALSGPGPIFIALAFGGVDLQK